MSIHDKDIPIRCIYNEGQLNYNFLEIPGVDLFLEEVFIDYYDIDINKKILPFVITISDIMTHNNK